jgi:hypothetical protein
LAVGQHTWRTVDTSTVSVEHWFCVTGAAI